MQHSHRFAHVLRLCDMVTFTVRYVESCDHGCAGCWRVSGMASGTPFGDVVAAHVGPYQHCTLIEALDLVATVSAWQSSALETLNLVEARPWQQMTLEHLFSE